MHKLQIERLSMAPTTKLKPACIPMCTHSQLQDGDKPKEQPCKRQYNLPIRLIHSSIPVIEYI